MRRCDRQRTIAGVGPRRAPRAALTAALPAAGGIDGDRRPPVAAEPGAAALPRRRPPAPHRQSPRRRAPSTVPPLAPVRDRLRRDSSPAAAARRGAGAGDRAAARRRSTTVTSRRPTTSAATGVPPGCGSAWSLPSTAALGRAAPAGTAATWSSSLGRRTTAAKVAARSGSLAGALERPTPRCCSRCYAVKLDKRRNDRHDPGGPCDDQAQRRVRRGVDGAGQAAVPEQGPGLRAVLRRLPRS